MKNNIFQKNILLKNYTTFKIGGPAKYFLAVKNKKELIEAIKSAKKIKLPVFILGGGSNVLFPDKGFNGLVIKMENSKLNLLSRNTVYVEAGVNSAKLVKFATDNSLSGIEWFTGIPGTVGGAIFGNAQAFGFKMSDSIESVEVLNLKTLKLFKLSNQQCKFSLKNSIFKKNAVRGTGQNFVIVSAVLKLKKGKKQKIKERIKEYIDYRKKCHPIKFPSAGSVFVNPEKKVKNKKEIIHAAYLIESCGLKGKKSGGAQISEQHANFIVNLGSAKAKDVLHLIKLAKQKVKKMFNINLEQEIIWR